MWLKQLITMLHLLFSNCLNYFCFCTQKIHNCHNWKLWPLSFMVIPRWRCSIVGKLRDSRPVSTIRTPINCQFSTITYTEKKKQVSKLLPHISLYSSVSRYIKALELLKKMNWEIENWDQVGNFNCHVPPPLRQHSIKSLKKLLSIWEVHNM